MRRKNVRVYDADGRSFRRGGSYSEKNSGEKNPDRAISQGRGRIADLRRVYLSSPPNQYYKVSSPSVEEISWAIAKLQAQNPDEEVMMTKRDIASAFRLIRLNPGL